MCTAHNTISVLLSSIHYTGRRLKLLLLNKYVNSYVEANTRVPFARYLEALQHNIFHSNGSKLDHVTLWLVLLQDVSSEPQMPASIEWCKNGWTHRLRKCYNAHLGLRTLE